MLEGTSPSLDDIATLKSQYEDLRAKYARIAVLYDELNAQVAALRDAACRNQQSGTESISARFHALVDEWKATRGHQSRVDKLVINQAYQAIIGLGPPAIPLLLKEMDERPSHWDWALRAIAQVDPVPKEAWGNLKQIAAAWVRWGKDAGYTW